MKPQRGDSNHFSYLKNYSSNMNGMFDFVVEEFTPHMEWRPETEGLEYRAVPVDTLNAYVFIAAYLSS